MNREARKRMGVKDTPIELVADSIEREFKNMPHLRIIGDRPMAEALAFVAIRRLRRFDREVKFRPGRRVIALEGCGSVVAGCQGVIRQVSRKRLIVHWEGRGADMLDKGNLNRLFRFA